MARKKPAVSTAAIVRDHIDIRTCVRFADRRFAPRRSSRVGPSRVGCAAAGPSHAPHPSIKDGMRIAITQQLAPEPGVRRGSFGPHPRKVS